MTTALVLGGAGFLGRHLVPKLMERGIEVHSVDPAYVGTKGTCWSIRNPESASKATAEPSDFVHGYKYAESFDGSPSVTVSFDYVFHLAANLTTFNIEERNRMGLCAFSDTQLDYSVARWLELHPPKERVVWMSSCATDAKDTENYAFVKYVSERFARWLGRHDFPISILRPYGGYGPGQSLSYPMPAIIDRALRHEDPLIVWGNKFTTRDWIHVDDIVEAMLMAADGKFPNAAAIPIGTGRAMRYGDLAAMIAAAVGYSPKIEADFSKPVGSTHRVATTAIPKMYGFEAKITLEEGIAQCVAARRKELDAVSAK